VLEITDVKDRDDKFDIGVMTDAVDSIEPTGFTECILFRRTLEEHNPHLVEQVEGDELTKRRSSTPSFTGALSVVVYRSLCVT
jgi:hypothetical protein